MYVAILSDMETTTKITTARAAKAPRDADNLHATHPDHAACCAPSGLPLPAESAAGASLAQLSERLKALADSTRLRMLTLLSDQAAPLCVCEINTYFAQRQPTISHHLRLLRQAGLIAGEKRGTWSYYWITAEGKRLLSAVLAGA